MLHQALHEYAVCRYPSQLDRDDECRKSRYHFYSDHHILEYRFCGGIILKRRTNFCRTHICRTSCPTYLISTPVSLTGMMNAVISRYCFYYDYLILEYRFRSGFIETTDKILQDSYMSDKLSDVLNQYPGQPDRDDECRNKQILLLF